MQKPVRSVVTLMSICAFGVMLSACDKKPTTGEGPAERAGQQIDKAAANAGQALDKAAVKAGAGLQKLGEKMQESGQDAQKKEQ